MLWCVLICLRGGCETTSTHAIVLFCLVLCVCMLSTLAITSAALHLTSHLQFRIGPSPPPPLHTLGTAISCLAFSRDGQFLASGSMDSHVFIWNLENKRVFTQIPCERFCHVATPLGGSMLLKPPETCIWLKACFSIPARLRFLILWHHHTHFLLPPW